MLGARLVEKPNGLIARCNSLVSKIDAQLIYGCKVSSVRSFVYLNRSSRLLEIRILLLLRNCDTEMGKEMGNGILGSPFIYWNLYLIINHYTYYV